MRLKPGMFYGATVFNQDIGNWNTSNVINTASMFFSATQFDQNVGNWNVSKVEVMNEMFSSSGLSRSNYDSLLMGWSSQNVLPGVPFDAGSVTYSSSSAAARSLLTSPVESGGKGWTISDGGEYSP